MKNKFYLLLFAIYTLGFYPGFVFGQTEQTYNLLSQGFKNPPLSAQPLVYHWWLGGTVDTVRLREELKSLKEAGIAGFTIFEIGSRDTILVKPGPAFLSKKSLEDIKFAVEEAEKLGLEVGLNTASSWNAGGNWIPPRHAAKSIYFSTTSINGSGKKKLKLPFPDIPKIDAWGKPGFIEFDDDGKPEFYQEIAVLALPADVNQLDTAQIKDVSRFFDPASERLEWDAPPGNWTIHRYVCSNSGENLKIPSANSAGPIVDHYDADATAFHFNYILEKLESVLGDLSQTALKSLYMASYEAKGFAWTTSLPLEFKRINGYEITKLLPALFNDSLFHQEIIANLNYHFYRTLSELMIDNFYKKSGEICHQYGLKNNSEAGGPGLPLHNVPVEPIKALGSLDIPRGEFWINHSRFNEQGIDISRVVKEVSAAAHIYGRKYVEMEAFTTFQQWQEGPFEMKPLGDRAFCEGMNRVVVHGSTHNPVGSGFPGIVYHAGTHYNDKRVWWSKVRPFNQYLARISYISQEADFVSDILYYYGDTIPNYGGHKNSRFTPGPGYDYEIVNSEILLQLDVQDGQLVIPSTGAKFRLMVLDDEKKINPEVLLKLEELVAKGAVILGERPVGIANVKSNHSNKESEDLLNQLWATGNSTGKQIIYQGIQPAELLDRLKVLPDFSYPGDSTYHLDYIHYSAGDLDFYFIRNTKSEWISRNCAFRQQDKIPELWDPVSGEIIPIPIYHRNASQIYLPLTLAPYESTFVVFKKGEDQSHFNLLKSTESGKDVPRIRYTSKGFHILDEGNYQLVSQRDTSSITNFTDVLPLEGAWEVFFPSGWGAPERLVLGELRSWTESENQGVEYFSGQALYEKSFVHVPNTNAWSEARFLLDLGDISHVAEVWLNEQPLGITWSEPFQFDVTDYLQPGNNTLKIEVANTWSNRLVGDAVLNQNYTQTNIKSTVVSQGFFIRAPWKEVPLIKSGLLGPVRIIKARTYSKINLNTKSGISLN